MPFQPINFLNVPIQRGSFLPEDLVERWKQGFQAGQMPAQMKRTAESEELANALNRMKIQNQPENERLQQALMQEKIKQLQAPKAPTEFEQKMKLLEKYLSGQDIFGSQQPQISPENIQNPQQLNNSNEIPENPLSTQIQSSPQNQLSPQQSNQQKNLADSFIRHILGLPQETPDEKRENDFLYDQKKNAIKNENEKDYSKLTQRTASELQEQNTNIENLVPSIRDFAASVKNVPFQNIFSTHLSPQKQSDYETKITALTDAYMKAKNLPNTEKIFFENRDKIFARKRSDSDQSYTKRLLHQADELEKTFKSNLKKLESGHVSSEISLNKKIIPFSLNGETFDIPDDEVERFLRDNPKAKKL